MAFTLNSAATVGLGAGVASVARQGQMRPLDAAKAFVPSFLGLRLPSPSARTAACPPAPSATSIRAATSAKPKATSAFAIIDYQQPTWSDFEMGHSNAVYWETANGLAPRSGEQITIYFNPAATNLNPNSDYGIAFNGGFNGPIMCGGEPRRMTRRDRGPACDVLYSIRVNIPRHAFRVEFSFTDGADWHGSYRLELETDLRIRNMSLSELNAYLTQELSVEDGCEGAIFPDVVPTSDRCMMPAGLAAEGGDRCELDIVLGCTDPDSPNYDPFATHDDATCDLQPKPSGTISAGN